MNADLLVARFFATLFRYRFNNDEPCVGLERAFQMLKHRLVLMHLVIRIHDDRRVE